MEIFRLKPGTPAPIDRDCISIESSPNGGFVLAGSVLVEAQSVAMVGGPEYATVNEAEAEGIAWAAENGVEELYVAVPRDDSQSDGSPEDDTGAL